jgi:SAM-dependent methyltransferase
MSITSAPDTPITIDASTAELVPASGPSTASTDELAERLFDGAVAALELATIHLGLRLGIYDGLREHGPATSSQLADRLGLDARYLREWLEQQGAAQLVRCQDPAKPEEERVFELSAATAAVLLEPEAPSYLGPLAHLTVGLLTPLRDVADAFRTGAGVGFGRYGDDLRHGLGVLNGATFDRALAGWIAAMPDIEARLCDGDRPRVLDLGCGVGRSTLAIARTYPRTVVRGIDLDAPSVDHARRSAAEEGLAHRVSFATDDAAVIAADERYDLVTILEALHDMGDPVGALRAARGALADRGAVLIADQLTRDGYAADGDPMERFQYGCSVLHCLPATRAEAHVTAHGTVIRAATVERWAREAGFAEVTVLDVEDPFWRFYRLDRATR